MKFLCAPSFLTRLLTAALFMFCHIDSANAGDDVQFVFSSEVESEPSFRGRNLTSDVELWSYFDYSWSGISSGLRLASMSHNESNSNYDGFISYSYATELFYFTGGFNVINHFDISEDEIFFEVSGREDFFNFTPSVLISQEIGGSRTYTELSLSQDIIHNDLLFNPHARISFGDYYSTGFKENHYDIGMDITKRIKYDGVDFFFTASLNAVMPMDGIKSAIGEDDIYVQSSVGLLIRFN